MTSLTSRSEARTQPATAWTDRTERAPAAEGQRLNSMDCTMLAVNRALRTMGAAGFETQTIMQLGGRINPGRLRTALRRLEQEYPIVAARLAVQGRGGPRWQFRPDRVCRLHESHLPASDPASVLDRAAHLLSQSRDLGDDDPVGFHLLHRPDGRDVFLMQYNHTLMDNMAAVPVLREIDRLFDPAATLRSAADIESRDLIADYRQQFPRLRRLRAAWRTADSRLRSLRGATGRLVDDAALKTLRTVPRKPPETPAPLPVRITTRSLNLQQTQALEARVKQVCRLSGLSLALLGSAFRAIDQLSPAAGESQRRYIAGLGLDLGLRGRQGPLFQNLVSLVPLCASQAELSDRGALWSTLSGRLREQLQRDIDLGVLELGARLRRWPGFVHSSTARLLRRGYSLWYACFDNLDSLGSRFCQTPLDEAFQTGPCWPSIGMTLIANPFRGRLLLQITWQPDTLTESRVNEFADLVVADLLSPDDAQTGGMLP